MFVGTSVPGGKVRGFRSKRAFERVYGAAPEGYEWHHIVEQSKVPQFGPEPIYNNVNSVLVTRGTNRALNAFYSGNNRLLTGQNQLIIRRWLRGKSWQEQYAFGLWAMEQLNRGKLP